MLRNHSVHLLFSRLFSIRHNFLLVHALFSHFFFSLSLLICGTPFRPSHSVPCTSSELSLWGHPPSRRAIRSEAQVQGYQRGAGPCSQRHDLSLRGSRVLSSVLAKLKSAFSLWYLCSHFLPPGFDPSSRRLLWLCDRNKDRQSSSSCPLIFIFSTCRSWAVVAVVPLMWVVQMKSSFQKENYAHVIIFWWHENKSQFGTSSQTLYLPVTVFP